ncbi:MAG: hypothetical protein ACI87W_002952 [Halieaceae bacterium]
MCLSNSFSNDGIANAQFQYRDFDSSATVLPGSADSVPLSREQRPGYDVPQSLVDSVSAVTDADYLYTRGEDVAYYVDVSQEQVGTTVLGKPIYDFVDDQGRYVFEGFNDRDINDVQEQRSLWEVRLGFSIQF